MSSRGPNLTDARARLVVISEKRTALCEVAAKAVTDVQREWREHLGAERHQRLRKALLSLREITDPYA